MSAQTSDPGAAPPSTSGLKRRRSGGKRAAPPAVTNGTGVTPPPAKRKTAGAKRKASTARANRPAAATSTAANSDAAEWLGRVAKIINLAPPGTNVTLAKIDQWFDAMRPIFMANYTVASPVTKAPAAQRAAA